MTEKDARAIECRQTVSLAPWPKLLALRETPGRKAKQENFEDCSHGFRPGRSAQDAIESVMQSLQEGRHAVYDADLAGYFDTIPNDKLIAGVRPLGCPRQAYRDLNSYVRAKLTWHLRRRSQRSWRPPAGTSAHAHLNRMGLIQL